MRPGRDAQLAAAAPATSTWVAANAGSGKTRVLTERVARLLLAGVEPARILCLTYTKAAAAEMQTRLFRTLGAWAMMPEDRLRAALAELGEPGEALPIARLDAARTLFARALETPGGLRIQTIHAFCDALLRRFPLEAGVSPQFAVLEDRQARALRAELLDALADTPEFAALAGWLPAEDLDGFLAEIGSRRAAFDAPFDAPRLAAALGAPAAPPPDPLQLGDAEALAAAVALGRASGPKDRGVAETIARAMTLDPSRRQEALEKALLTGAAAKTKAPFTPSGAFPAKAIRAAHPDLALRLDAIADRLADARQARLGWKAFDRARALDAFARRWLAGWDARKAALGLLDFDDLIRRTVRLLSRPETAAFVLWRLDGGIDHVLVDEAQDTSPAQWRVVAAITDEFFAGRGARDADRTLFVVGDEKQSIYSFQGADPAAFGAMRATFAARLDGVGRRLEEQALHYSYRSAAPILALVDAVFAGPAGAAFAAPAEHRADDATKPGRVELWPFLPKPDKDEDGEWDHPHAPPPGEDPVETLAARVAATIRGWLDAGRVLPGDRDRRAIRAGDVLILVQRRGAIFHAVIRALKRAGVPVAGADLLRVGAELAVRDLLAALRVAATPADDLSLAALLRSPIGGFSEAALFDLAHGRKGTLWDALNAADPAPPIRDALRDLRAQADYLRPYELLQRLLIRQDGRRALTARLGAEAEDGIDALLEQALAYERVEPPSLSGFLAWIDRDAVEAKRRMDEATDQVRVMTVHGAKGLEAPIVILPDTAKRKETAKVPRVARLGPHAVWALPRDDRCAALQAADETRAAEVTAENRRLLYVALTRPRTWLIVAGAGLPGDDGWHALVTGALDRLGAREETGAHGPVRVLDHAWTEAPGLAAAPPPAPGVLPDWARAAPPTPPPPVAPRSPSALGGGHALPGEGLDEAEARLRGTRLHLLLEALPAWPRAEWPRLALRLLPDAPDRDALLAEAAALIDDPALAEVFAPDALAEVDVAGFLPGFGPAIGRIDRLLVRPDRVLAVDFKSNRVVPDRVEDAPEGVLRQLGAYAAALRAIHPDRTVETAVLWTRARRLMTVPPALGAAALARALLDPVRADP